MKKPITLQQAIAYFADTDRAFDYAKFLRWPDGRVSCPRCGSDSNSFVSTRKIWFCNGCKKQFTVKVGTIFEDSPIGLDKWMTAVWMICNCKNGISSYELHRSIGVTQKSAWFMLHRIRKAMESGSMEMFGGEDGGPVEVDEAYVGGEPKNRHLSKRSTDKYITDEKNGIRYRNPKYKSESGRGTRKVPVIGILDRELRQVRAHAVPQVNREALQDAILSNVSKGQHGLHRWTRRLQPCLSLPTSSMTP